MTRQIAMTLGLLCLALGAVQAGEMTEAQKRSEFVKAYASAKPEDRVTAVQLLKGAKEAASMSFLSRVATTDVESAVRLSAFLLISDMEDPMGRLEPVVLEMFRNEKNRPTKISMLPSFTKLKTKTAATEESIKFLCTFLCPGTYGNDRGNENDGGGDDGGGGPAMARRSKEEIDAMRKDFTDVLAVVNSLTGQSFPTSIKAHEQAKKWWALHKNDFLKADAEMIVKLRDEAQAAAKQATAETKK